MSSYMIRNLPSGLIGRAKQKARADNITLDAVLTTYLESYAEGQTPKQLGAAGGHARAATLTQEERSASARRAVQARWAKNAETRPK